MASAQPGPSSLAVLTITIETGNDTEPHNGLCRHENANDRASDSIPRRLTLCQTTPHRSDSCLYPRYCLQDCPQARPREKAGVRAGDRQRSQVHHEQVQEYILSQSTEVRVDKRAPRPVSSPPKKGGLKSAGVGSTSALREEIRQWR